MFRNIFNLLVSSPTVYDRSDADGLKLIAAAASDWSYNQASKPRLVLVKD